jgi:peptidase E
MTQSKTKFIVSGGFAEKAKDKGLSFCKEIVDESGVERKILECLFALPEDRWDVALEKDRKFFRKALPDAVIEFSMASEEEFLGQIASSDAIYFRGGDTKKLIDRLSAIKGWQAELQGKIVIGSSAGAYALAKRYLDLTGEAMELRDGFGLLPIKTVAHYKSEFFSKSVKKRRSPEIPPETVLEKVEWGGVDKFMLEHEPDLEYVPLREGEFRIFEK